MRCNHLFAGLIVSALATSAAWAEPFSGPHVEAIIGWNHNNDSAYGRIGSGSGLVYGGSAGYDFRLGDVVLGAAAEIADTTSNSCGTYNVPATPSYPSVVGRGCARDGRSIFVGPRLGYVAGEHALLYVTGGYANLRERTSFDGSIGGSPLKGTLHGDFEGFRIGGGVEYALSNHAFLKAEYRYTEAKDDETLRQSQVVTGFGFRF